MAPPSSGAGRWGLLLVGAGLGIGVLTGRVGLYVRGYYVPVLAVLALALVVVALLGPPRLGWRSLALLLLPVVAAVGIGPAQASRMAGVQLAGSPATRLGDGPNPLLEGRGGQVNLLQIGLAAQQVGPVSLMGRSVSVVGEVAGPTSIERLVMVCCAADARPVTVGVRGARLPSRGAWVRVDGALSAAGGEVVIVARSVRQVGVPAQPIL